MIKEFLLSPSNESTAFPKKIGTETFANLAKIKKHIAKINLILKFLLFLGHKYGIKYNKGLKVFIIRLTNW